MLEPLAGYLMLAERAAGGDLKHERRWNFGPAEQSEISVAAVAERAMRAAGRELQWLREIAAHPELPALRIDSHKAHLLLDWQSQFSISTRPSPPPLAWYACALAGADVAAISREQISAYARKTEGSQKVRILDRI
jgi:CDP-glucose 4,6-dehydratase